MYNKVRAPFFWVMAPGRGDLHWSRDVSSPDSPKTRFINKATGSSLGGPQASHFIALTLQQEACCLSGGPRTKAGAALPRRGQRWAARGRPGEEQDPSPAFSPLFLVENPLKSPSSPSDWGTHAEGGVFTGIMIHSLLWKLNSASGRAREGI